MRVVRLTRGPTLAAAIVLALGFAATAAGQETTGTIAGVVADTTGAVLPGATVTVKFVQTGAIRSFTTNAAGLYTAPVLQPGDYEITFSLSGFQPSTVRGIQLHVTDRLEVNGLLAVGGLSQNVDVSAASQFVQPSPAVQHLIGSTQILELPLNNRNFVQLATLVPGVSSDLSDEVGIGLTSTVSISVNGARRNAVNWLVDGVSNVDAGSNITLLSTPTLESIQEFKMITSSYAAEWPRSGGGVINIITKGGSRKFSGAAYNFFRNNSLNANSFFRNRSSDPVVRGSAPRLRYQNPGYTIGGPLLPSRRKAFFFWSEEWRRVSRAPSASTFTTIDPAWLSDPSNANYVAPVDRDPHAVRMLALWPSPNLGSSQFINSNPSVNNTRQEVIRADVELTGRWKVVGRYTHDLSETVEPGGLFTNTLVPNVSATHTAVPGQVMAAELRGTWGRMLNELKYHFSSNRIHTSDDPGNVNTRAQLGVGIPELYPENGAGRLPSINMSAAVATVTTIQVFNIEYNNHSISDNLTWQRGSHTWKFGGLATFEQKNENANNNTQGLFTFAPGGGRTAFQNFLTGNRDGLCGTACTYAEAQEDVTNELRWNRFEFFAQDTWRIRPNVTIDAGVRYGLYPGLYDLNNVLSTFVPALYDRSRAPTCATPTCTALVPNTGDPLNGLIVGGFNSPYGRAIYPTEKGNIQPRAGVSWDPRRDGKSIVRAGYGLYYDQPLVGIFEQNAFSNPPYVQTVNLLNPALSNPSAGTTPGTTGLRSLFATSAPFKTPRTQQWNVGYQRMLYRRGSIDVGYVGAQGDRLIQQVDLNQPDPVAVLANGLNISRPYLGYAGITMRQTTAYNNYKGLLTQFRHEGGRQGTYVINYTLSRNRTSATNDRDAADNPQNPQNLEGEYADARTDRRHIFTANYIYELPFFLKSGRALVKGVLGGWQVSGITTVNSGAPISRVIANTNASTRGSRANLVGDPKTGQLPFPYWFDPAAFAPPASGSFGTPSRIDSLRLPGRNQTDLALSKNFYPFARRVQFRADFINAFNHTQWLAVDNACSAAATVTLSRCDIGGTDTFGQITSTRAPREIQLSLKLFW